VLTVYSSDQDTFDEQRGRLLQMIAPHLAAVIHTAVQASAAKAAPPADARPSVGIRDLRLVSTR
jgi:hypothetical protein